MPRAPRYRGSRSRVPPTTARQSSVKGKRGGGKQYNGESRSADRVALNPASDESDLFDCCAFLRAFLLSHLRGRPPSDWASSKRSKNRDTRRRALPLKGRTKFHLVSRALFVRRLTCPSRVVLPSSSVCLQSCVYSAWIDGFCIFTL